MTKEYKLQYNAKLEEFRIVERKRGKKKWKHVPHEGKYWFDSRAEAIKALNDKRSFNQKQSIRYDDENWEEFHA